MACSLQESLPNLSLFQRRLNFVLKCDNFACTQYSVAPLYTPLAVSVVQIVALYGFQFLMKSNLRWKPIYGKSMMGFSYITLGYNSAEPTTF